MSGKFSFTQSEYFSCSDSEQPQPWLVITACSCTAQYSLQPVYPGSDPAYNAPRSKLRAAPAAWVVGSSDQRSLRQSEDRTPSYVLISTNQRTLDADICPEDVDH